ncbi:isoaspartyl peptidase/L-asparaginase [Bremerella cremea]|uniref:Isoaspartyl peptidase n=1 Tax=Bremerella cremea TaxID=1031537 RepID=A0A368KV39_9BACT|nr:isoaspartyl peptidase/L-asparaginase [Bremerella cremea]RCS51916.1 isoaspartyl peptidase/L-asparaginase [Bremerella cremea]
MLIRNAAWLVMSFMIMGLFSSALVQAEEKRWAIVLHGGAGDIPKDIPPELVQEYKQTLEKALATGEKILAEGGTALDAVQQTVMVMEDAPCFNAGRGAVFNAAGYQQLDASIMDGSNLACGGVSAVETVRNPIVAARLVMEKTPHVLLTAKDADEFAKASGLEIVPRSYYFNEARWKDLVRRLKKKGQPIPAEPPYGRPNVSLAPTHPADVDLGNGTVGCAALDQNGNLAAATSTGGLTGKMVGRVGDSPIIGAGTYADNAGCAISGTGTGEQYIRHAIGFQVNFRVREMKQSLQEAVDHCLTKVLDPGDGGLIAVDAEGNMVLEVSSTTLARGWSDWKGSRGVAIWDEPLED